MSLNKLKQRHKTKVWTINNRSCSSKRCY